MTSINLTIIDNLINIYIHSYFTSISIINLLIVNFCDIHFRCKFKFQLKLKYLLNLFVILLKDIKIIIIFIIIMKLRVYDISIVIKEIKN